MKLEVVSDKDELEMLQITKEPPSAPKITPSQPAQLSKAAPTAAARPKDDDSASAEFCVTHGAKTTNCCRKSGYLYCVRQQVFSTGGTLGSILTQIRRAAGPASTWLGFALDHRADSRWQVKRVPAGMFL